MVSFFRAILSGILFLTILSSAEAQRSFYYGPRIGLCFSSFVGPNPRTTNFPVGAIIGMYGELKVTEKFSLQQDLLYTSAGSNYAFTSQPESHYKVSLTYLSFPMHADFKLIHNLHLQAGIQGSVLVSALTNMTNMGTIVKQDNLDGYNHVDYGPSAGISYEFTNGLNVSVRAYRGLKPVWKNTSGNELYNTYLQCLVGYRFGK